MINLPDGQHFPCQLKYQLVLVVPMVIPCITDRLISPNPILVVPKIIPYESVASTQIPCAISTQYQLLVVVPMVIPCTTHLLHHNDLPTQRKKRPPASLDPPRIPCASLLKSVNHRERPTAKRRPEADPSPDPPELALAAPPLGPRAPAARAPPARATAPAPSNRSARPGAEAEGSQFYNCWVLWMDEIHFALGGAGFRAGPLA